MPPTCKSTSATSPKTPISADLFCSEHDPEKWPLVFGKDHAQTKIRSAASARQLVLPAPFAADLADHPHPLFDLGEEVLIRGVASRGGLLLCNGGFGHGGAVLPSGAPLSQT